MNISERLEWHKLTPEDPYDPHRQIVDAHFHISDHFSLDQFLSNTRAGHNVNQAVFVETISHYRADGPEHLRPVGETEWVAMQAPRAEASGTRISGIVGFADLTLEEGLDEVLASHEAVTGGRIRGVRYGTYWDASSELPANHYGAGPELMTDPSFRRGIEWLGTKGYSFDASVYHPQLSQLTDLAKSVDGTTVAVNHIGKPLNVAPYTHRDAVRSDWRRGMQELAKAPNVALKIGGIGMDFVFRTGWPSRPAPPNSDEIVEYWADDIRWCIDTFGPSRCMFSSNYPADGESMSYAVLWNVYQKIASIYSEDEQAELFSGTATRVYRLG